jgi:hypothetical protein
MLREAGYTDREMFVVRKEVAHIQRSRRVSKFHEDKSFAEDALEIVQSAFKGLMMAGTWSAFEREVEEAQELAVDGLR